MNIQSPKNKAVSMIELVVVIGVAAVFSSIMLKWFIVMDETSQVSMGQLTAIREADTILEDMKVLSNADVVANYSSGGNPGNLILLTLLDGQAQVEIDSSNFDLLEVNIYLHWRDKNGRVYGEDLDFDGVLDAGEDFNSNGFLDSSYSMSALLAQR